MEHPPQLLPAVEQHNKITGYTSQYQVEPKIYRAGVSLSAAPKNLPADLHYEKFAGGKYAGFILTGPYSNLPEACGRVFQMVADQTTPLRDDWYLENYANDPRTTPSPNSSPIS